MGTVLHKPKTSMVMPPLLHCAKDNAVSYLLPDDAEKALRSGLADFCAFLKDNPFVRIRLCWYADTRKGDIGVNKHSSYANLFMAVGESRQV